MRSTTLTCSLPTLVSVLCAVLWLSVVKQAGAQFDAGAQSNAATIYFYYNVTRDFVNSEPLWIATMQLQPDNRMTYAFTSIGDDQPNVTGAVFLGPIWSYSRTTLQEANVLHDIAATAAIKDNTIRGIWYDVPEEARQYLFVESVFVQINTTSNTFLGQCQIDRSKTGLNSFQNISQQLCSNTSNSWQPITWCQYQNPYLTILPISEVNYNTSKEECWGAAECNTLGDSGIDYTCDTTAGVMDTCTGVTSFTAIQAYIDFFDEENGKKPLDLRNRKKYPNPVIYTMMGLSSGRLVANIINYANVTGLVSSSGQTNAMVQSRHSSSIIHLESLSVGSDEHPLETLLIWVSSDGNSTYVQVVNTTEYPFPRPAQCVSKYFANNQEKLIDMALWESTEHHLDVIAAFLIFRKASPMSYRIDFHIMSFANASSKYRNVTECPQVQVVTWPINFAPWVVLSHPMFSKGSLMTVKHYFQVKDPFLLRQAGNQNNTNTRTILLLQGVRFVHLYQTEGKGQQLTAQSVTFGDYKSPSCFFAANSDQKVHHAVLFGEFIQRPKTSDARPKSRYLYQLEQATLLDTTGASSPQFDEMAPSQMMWLAVALRNSSEELITLISLSEFAQYSDIPANTTYDNPGAKPLSHPCQVLQWIDLFNSSEGCQLRLIVPYKLPRPAKHLAARFRSVESSNTGSSQNIAYTTTAGGENLLGEFLYTVLFVQFEIPYPPPLIDSMLLIGVQQRLTSRTDIVVAELNFLDYIGNINNFYASPNSYHLVVTVKRSIFNIMSVTRLIEICRGLFAEMAKDPNYKSPLLKYKPLCNTPSALALLNRGPPGINDFTWYASSCLPGTLCPNLVKPLISQVQNGYYTFRSFEVRQCERGYYCLNGQRITCPPGYKCPYIGMTSPLRCKTNQDWNTTCFVIAQIGAPGAIHPQPCPAGSVCPVPYSSDIQSPPGYMLNNFITNHDPRSIRSSINRTHPFIPCPLGSWCSLGASRYSTTSGNETNLVCPMAGFCNDSSVLEPTPCNGSATEMNYCPAGSWNESLCPTGFFCTSPVAKEPCNPHRYCPQGSVSEKTCPGGFYCPTPSQMIRCPEDYYCKPGSLKPKKCPILTNCPAGTESEKNSGIAVVVIFLIFFVPTIAWIIFLRIQNKNREKRQAKYLAEMNRTPKPSPSLSNEPPEDQFATEYHVQRAERRRGNTGRTPSAMAMLPMGEPSFTIDFTFTELGLQLKSNDKLVLKGVTGQIKSREVTAVMGPSGAGKSTFITTLCGKATYGVRTGHVYINGCEEDLTAYRKVVGFVPQDDIMLRMMTVKEILTFHARVRLPKEYGDKEQRERVNDVIRDLGLYDIRHSIIGDETKRGISGGQRKRVNIGMEMVANPIVLFLDEPTSGLDSTSSKEVCACLKRIAESGLTIVTVIHQPRYEIFKMFHSVLLLGKGGQTVYLGPSENALEYFRGLGFHCPEHANPPDFFMDVISGEVPREGHPEFKAPDLFNLWDLHIERKAGEEAAVEGRESKMSEMDLKENSMAKTIKGDQRGEVSAEARRAKNRKTANILYQTWLFMVRAVIQQIRDWQGLLFDGVLVLISGVFLGLIYYQVFYVGPEPKSIVKMCPQPMLDVTPSPCKVPRNDPLPGQAVMASLSLALASVSASLRLFGNERTNFWRESSAGISTFAYYMGKSLAHMPTIFIAPLMFLIIYYQLVTPLGNLSGYYLICFLVYWTAAGYGYLISIMFPPSVAQLFAVLSVLFNMMFSGALPRFEQLKKIVGGVLYYPTFISYIRWSQEAFYLHEIEQYKEIYDDVQSGMDLYEYEFSHYDLDIGMIFVIGVVIRIAAYVFLEVLHRNKRK